MTPHRFSLRTCRLLTGCALAAALSLSSCHENYIMDEEEPEWLGSSIYDYLKEAGCYTQFVRLIDELHYDEVLSRTGSKTLFVVDDATFNEFYKANEWHVSSYDQLTPAQKRLLLNSNMLNNVYYSDMLGRTEGPVEGKCLRRTTALSVMDSVQVVGADAMPPTSYWDDARRKGRMVVLTDNTAAPMVHFTSKFMQANSISENDFDILHNGQSRTSRDEVFVNGVRIASANHKCKNGVVHRLERLQVPLVNMADAVHKDADSKAFATLMDRFCAPYYNEEATRDYQRIYGTNDSVFVKHYFTTRGQNNLEFLNTPADTLALGYLNFDPGWNIYTADNQTDMEEDMGVMFVPTDEVLEQYWNEGGGRFLKERYGTWDAVPDRVLDDLVSNHMKQSFVASVPSKFYQVKNDGQVEMGVETSNVLRTQLCCNGVVYYTNRVYPPVAYVSVSAPTLVNDNMRVADWAIEKLEFYAYLRSMDSYYSFILPTDEAFSHYIDPISLAQGEPEEFEFYYDPATASVGARVYNYDPATGQRGQQKRLIAPTANSTSATRQIIANRLNDILDYHIIVDTIDHCKDGKTYYHTKGGGTIRVEYNPSKQAFDLCGGYQSDNGQPVEIAEADVYDYTLEGNGKTYVTDVVLQPSMKSVYEAISERAGTADAKGPFYEFFQLMEGSSDVFYRDEDYATINYAVKPFNTYHYTIYVPDNASVRQAISEGLPTWAAIDETIDSLTRLDEQGLLPADIVIEDVRDSLASIITDFVQYHIQDNSVYIGGGSKSGSFETSTMNAETLAFYRLGVTCDNRAITVTDAHGTTHHVLTDDPTLYNIMTRDYLFNTSDIRSATQIETSSFAVIHQIDGVLRYK